MRVSWAIPRGQAKNNSASSARRNIVREVQYSHYSVKSVPFLSTLDINGAKNGTTGAERTGSVGKRRVWSRKRSVLPTRPRTEWPADPRWGTTALVRC